MLLPSPSSQRMRQLAANSIPHASHLAMALLLLLLLTLAHFSSSGIVRGGDEGGDGDGSGIGGTGRMLLPTGEGGIGGTGLKPFLGMNAAQEVEILVDPALRATAITETLELPVPTLAAPLEPLPALTRVTRDFVKTTDSSALDISEVIQLSLEHNAAYFARLRTELRDFQWAETGVGETVPTQSGDDVTWNAVTQFLNSAEPEPNTSTQLSQTGEPQPEAPSAARPEPLQRPQLPPLQRVNPIQRAGILPPHVRPMHL